LIHYAIIIDIIIDIDAISLLITPLLRHYLIIFDISLLICHCHAIIIDDYAIITLITPLRHYAIIDITILIAIIDTLLILYCLSIIIDYAIIAIIVLRH
jgi:hypothetical protein